MVGCSALPVKCLTRPQVDRNALDPSHPIDLLEQMIADPGETIQEQSYEAVLDPILASIWFAKTAGDFLEAGPSLGGGTKALAACARQNHTRKRVWAAEEGGSPHNPGGQLSGHLDRESRCDSFLRSMEDFSNVRMLPGGLGSLDAGPKKLCCALIRHSRPIDFVKGALSDVWRRLAPGGAMVVQGMPDVSQTLEELVNALGREEIDSLGQNSSQRLIWAKKVGGVTVPSLPVRQDLPRVIVASYGEDLEWTRDLWLPKAIYDATGCSTLEGVVRVQNRAREAGQYLHHIVSNYPHFHEWEVFLQGRPFDHLSGPLVELLGHTPEWGDFHPFGPLVPFDERVWIHDQWAAQFAREWFGEVPANLHWVPGAQFAVSSKTLLSKPLAYWAALQKKVLDEEERSPWAIERLWQAIFCI